MRRIALAGLLTVALLAAAGCGGSKKSSSPPPPPSTTVTHTTAPATTVHTTTTTTTPISTTGLGSIPKSCSNFAGAAAKIGQAVGAAASGGDTSALKAYFAALTAKAPSDIKPSFEVLEKAISKYVDALKALNLKPGQTPSADQIAKMEQLGSELQAADVATASQKVEAWVKGGCH